MRDTHRKSFELIREHYICEKQYIHYIYVGNGPCHGEVTVGVLPAVSTRRMQPVEKRRCEPQLRFLLMCRPEAAEESPASSPLMERNRRLCMRHYNVDFLNIFHNNLVYRAN